MKFPRIVVLDTQILIWAIKEEAESGQEAMIPRATAFLRSLEEEGARVLVPSVILAELLFRVPPDRLANVAAEINRRFMVVPFDAAAAAEFAKLWQRAKAAKAATGVIETPKPTRAELKADLMILATAIVQGAVCLYTHDVRLQNAAQQASAAITVADMPQKTEQLIFPVVTELPSPDKTS